MTKEVNVRHVFTQTKKEGGGPPFFVLVTDGSNHLATCRCSDTTKAPILGAFVVSKHVSMLIWYTMCNISIFLMCRI